MLSGVINTNVNALYALNSLANTANTANTLEQELSSGLSINSPADNPAGFIAAQGFTSQLSGTNQALSNANQSISLVQTANGAITQQINILQNILSIASQAANGGATSAQLASLQQVVSQLTTQVSAISNQTNFNGVSLLNGTFQGINFQVGAQAGQTIGLSIANTASNQVGAYQTAVAGALYTTTGAGTGGVADNTGNSFTITQGTTAAANGAFTAGAVGVSGSAGNAAFTVSANSESALGVSQSVNANTSKTNVSATADTSVALTVTAGSFAFTLGNGTGIAQTNGVTISSTVTSVSQSGLSNLVNAINNNTGTTGITASVNSQSQLVLTNATGDNISLKSFTGTGTLAAGGVTVNSTAATSSATIQGLTSLQSTQSFSLAATASDIGLGIGSNLSAVSSVNVSTTAGATAALNVVGFALQQLESLGGQLGATQQQLQATVSNLQVAATNLTAAKGVVEDANIPQVTTQLTQTQILQQAGISALSQSNTLQQSFLKLLQ
jgi:flagellin